MRTFNQISTFMAGWEGRVWIGSLYAWQRQIGGTLASNFFFFFFFKWLHENLKTLKITPRSNKGGLFVEILGYHNGTRRGCLQVPVSVKTSDQACELFLGWGKRHDVIVYKFLYELRLVIGHISSFQVGERGGGEFENQNPQPPSSLEKN